MDKKTIRPDDYESRSIHLKKLTDDELKNYFWTLAEKAVDPLINLAQKNTSPAIERSVLLRMGFSSIEAKAIVEKTIQNQLMGKGAGHVVYRYSQIKNIGIRDAGLELMKDSGWSLVSESFGVKKS
ncbi:MAG TPA: ornithine aminomutase subunit alpha [Bacillota bacterium]|nr:ornithine aminomutase subunit alpha [Bacillota bacterium]HPF41930.1 ornithine aminomutase subunit alpha [Bacillota bacterium]HPJ85597.1 ornithine aminomutase subunit alpha [Bacillota bacterium]HPQ61451.1 ornithine aminomutase subunit alpha [Bacillota bacterium]HRX91707.1 ornithine aminomutase subunit alpha [Candidatus Izemoplasmatales bacterium]